MIKREKVNLPNLKIACTQMIRMIDEIEANGGPGFAMLMSFVRIADDIRFELDGSESCVTAVRDRAQSAQVEKETEEAKCPI